MKKGKYINIYVIIACLSHKNEPAKMQRINELINKACAPCTKIHQMNDYKKTVLQTNALKRKKLIK